MPLTKQALRDWIILKIKELDAEGLNQAEIATQLKCSQQLVSYYLKKIREQDRIQLEQGHMELAYTYRVVLDNLRKIRRELWQDLRQTTDKRTKASFMQTLIEVNLRLIELATSNDIVLATVKNAEKIAEEAKKDLQRARAKGVLAAAVNTSGGGTPEQEAIEEDIELELNDNNNTTTADSLLLISGGEDDGTEVVAEAAADNPDLLIAKYNQIKRKGRRPSSTSGSDGVEVGAEEEGVSVTTTHGDDDVDDVDGEGSGR